MNYWREIIVLIIENVEDLVIINKSIKKFAYWQPQPQISKPERSLFIGSSGSGKTHLMLSISKNLNPKNIYIISKLEDQYPSK